MKPVYQFGRGLDSGHTPLSETGDGEEEDSG